MTHIVVMKTDTFQKRLEPDLSRLIDQPFQSTA